MSASKDVGERKTVRRQVVAGKVDTELTGRACRGNYDRNAKSDVEDETTVADITFVCGEIVGLAVD